MGWTQTANRQHTHYAKYAYECIHVLTFCSRTFLPLSVCLRDVSTILIRSQCAPFVPFRSSAAMMDLPSPIALLDAFAPESLAPTTLWGVFVRIYGLVFAFAIGMLYRQIIPLAGEDGLFPIKGRLDRIRADYPNVIERIVRYPTLHWFFHSDRALKAMLAVGTVAGLVFTVIGVHSRLGLFIMWTIYLSFSNMMGFMYPWSTPRETHICRLVTLEGGLV